MYDKTEQISVGQSIGYLIREFKMKNHIVNYLYNTIDLSQYKTQFIETGITLKQLKDNPHYVTCNYEGFGYYLVFKKIMSRYYCVLIDKRYVKYDGSNVNYNFIKIISVKLRAKERVYQGTIFDGKVIKSGDQSIFLINDCYLLAGTDVKEDPMKKKIKMLDSFINESIIHDINLQPFTLKICKLYNYDELIDLAYNKIPNSKADINGLLFLPKKSGQQYLFQEGRQIIEEKRTFAKFQVKKTNIPDVYDMYLYNEDEDLVRRGIAHIPSMKCSHFCKRLFDDKNSYTMKCEYYPKFRKWIPIATVEGDPETVEEVEKRLSKVTA